MILAPVDALAVVAPLPVNLTIRSRGIARFQIG